MEGSGVTQREEWQLLSKEILERVRVREGGREGGREREREGGREGGRDGGREGEMDGKKLTINSHSHLCKSAENSL